MIKIFYISVLTTFLFAYIKYTDDNNVYFESTHFKVIAGKSYENSSSVSTMALKYLNIAEYTWQIQIDTLGFKYPLNSDSKKIDLYIGNHSAYNYETKKYETIDVNYYAGWASNYASDRTPYFVINPEIDDNVSKVTISHEFFHTVQYAYFNYEYNSKWNSDIWWDNSIWWLEATATLFEDEVYDDIDDYIRFLDKDDSFFYTTYKSFEVYDGNREYSMVIFAKYLKEKYGMQIIKKSFEQLESIDSTGYFETIDVVLKNEYDSSMEKEIKEFAFWIANPSKYFEEGSLYPVAKRFLKSDTVTLGKGGVVLYEDITPSWNLTTLSSSDANASEILSENIVWTWEEGSWYNNIPNDSYNEINTTSIDKAYWVYSTKDQNQTNYFTYYDNTQFDINSLSNGWNFLGTSEDLATDSFQDALIVWQYKSGNWYGYSSDEELYEKLLQEYNILNSVTKYSGFWLYK